MGILPVVITIILGTFDIIMQYIARISNKKGVSLVQQIVSIIGYIAYIISAFIVLVGIISLLNEYTQSANCGPEDLTCIRTNPRFSMQCHQLYNKYPFTFRTTKSELIEHVKTWAFVNKFHAVKESEDIIQVVIILYWTFLEDLFVNFLESKESEGFITVLVEAKLRLGYQDPTTDLFERVESLYIYLSKMYKPFDYSFI